MTISKDEWPKYWEVINLGTICDIEIGRTPPRDNPNYWGGSHTWISIADLKDQWIVESKENITDLAIKDGYARLVKKGTLLMSFKLTIGKLAFAGKDIFTNEAIAALSIKDQFKGKITAEFLYYALQAIPLEQGVILAVKGKTLNKKSMETIPVPLPDLSMQRRIVARIEALIGEVREMQILNTNIATDINDLFRSLVFEKRGWIPSYFPMSKLVKLITPNVDVQENEQYYFAGVYSFGRGVFPGKSKYGRETSYHKLTKLKSGYFTYPKLMAWEGALGVVPPECEGYVLSPEYPVFEVDERKVLPEVLDVYFRTPSIWPLLAELSTGTNARRRRLKPEELLRYEVPLPPMPIQFQLREAKKELGNLQEVKDTERLLSKLESAILAQAFRGEL